MDLLRSGLISAGFGFGFDWIRLDSLAFARILN